MGMTDTGWTERMRKYSIPSLRTTVTIAGLATLIFSYIWSTKSQNENKIKQFCVSPTGLAEILATHRRPNEQEAAILLEWSRWSQIPPEMWTHHISDIENYCRKQRLEIPAIERRLLH